MVRFLLALAVTLTVLTADASARCRHRGHLFHRHAAGWGVASGGCASGACAR